MPRRFAVASLLLAAAFVAIAMPAAAARTITVNSSDERELLKQRLPQGEFDFVELVERGRPDWLASACRKGVQCDVLVVRAEQRLPEDALKKMAMFCSVSEMEEWSGPR